MKAHEIPVLIVIVSVIVVGILALVQFGCA